MLSKEYQENTVGVFRETNEDGMYSYSFRNITDEEYMVVESGEPASLDCYPEAAFLVSATPFAEAEKIEWQLTASDRIMYADRVVINAAMATEITHNVVGDMLVEDAIGREVDVLRIKLEKQSPVSVSLQECNFETVASDSDYDYFEVDVPEEAVFRENLIQRNEEEQRFEVDSAEEDAFRSNQVERIEIDIRPFLSLFFK